ncbi:MAG TPA: hypothetical protein VFV58_39460 [Blastocatellia bacterium]|nr:hypothetical protein [Blastocatellia bacterium]
MDVSITEYAVQRGVNPQTIANAVRDGRITRNADGTIDSEAADREWEAHSRSKISAGPSGPQQKQGAATTSATEPVAGMMYADARALKEVYDAQRRKLELEVRAGELISRTAVERAAFSRFRMIRDACLNIPARVAPLLAGEKDEAKVFSILEEEIRRVFTDFAETNLT